MKNFVLTGSLFVAALAAGPAIAGPATDALSACVSDSTTGKDRKDLAQWIFAAMATHPDIKPLSNVSEANRDELDRKLAKLATKLLTESCSREAKLASKTEGQASIEAAFAFLGKLAMQELTSNQAVNASFSSYAKYLDKAKFAAVFADK